MTVLSDGEIEERLRNGTLGIIPFDPACLNGAGYDLRLNSRITLNPGENMLTATLERVELPDDLAGTLHVRSSLARAGVIASLALVDPGFRGQLTILLFNSSAKPFSMDGREKFLQLALHRLSMKTRRPYRGRYQDSQGIVDSRP